MEACYTCDDGLLALCDFTSKLNYKDKTIEVTRPCLVCNSCNGEFIPSFLMREGDKIVRDAKRKADGLYSKEEIKVVRDGLGLTQAEAAELFGGGKNAFSKYECGEVTQSVAMDKLLRICAANRSAFETLKKPPNVRGINRKNTVDSQSAVEVQSHNFGLTAVLATMQPANAQRPFYSDVKGWA